MRKKIGSALFLLLVFLIPFEHKYDKLFRHVSRTLLPQGATLPSFFDSKIYFYPSDLIALLLFALFLKKMGKELLKAPTAFLFALFLCALCSIFASPLAHYSLIYIRLLQLLTPILLFSYLMSQEEKEGITRKIFCALLSAALIQSLVAVAQYAHQGPIGLRLLSEPSAMEATFLSPPDGTSWLFDKAYAYAPRTLIRATGTLPHTNVLGGFLASSLIISYFFFLERPKWRPPLFLAIPLQFFAMALTFSRSALFGWLLATLFWFGYAYLQKREKKSLYLLGALLLLSFCASALILHKQILSRGGFVNYEGSPAEGADETRLQYQQRAFAQIRKSPFLGVGFQQLSLQEQEAGAVHNIYLYLAAEIGLFALLAFLLFIASLLLQAGKSAQTPYLQTTLALLLALLFIGGCDFYPILFQQGKLLFFSAAALVALHEKKEEMLVCT